MPSPAPGQGGSPTFSGEGVAPKVKRKITKANKAFKEAYKAVKPKKVTKANAKTALKRAAKIAGRANPATKSRIGKGKSTAQKLARKIRKKIWGVTKRLKK